MKLPNWVRIIWWIIITIIVGWIFYNRIPAILNGESVTIDLFIFLVWIALLLSPIFQEISLFGMKFKQSIEDLKQYLNTQLSIFKTEIQTSINTSNNINVTIPNAPSDDRLPGLEQRVNKAVQEALREEGITLPDQRPPLKGRIDVDDNTLFLFQVRNTIERKLRRIASKVVDLPDFNHSLPISKISQKLVHQERMHPKLMYAIREIYSVCSPAIHGEAVTDAQVAFVSDVAKEVIDGLSEIEKQIT